MRSTISSASGRPEEDYVEDKDHISVRWHTLPSHQTLPLKAQYKRTRFTTSEPAADH